MAKYVNWGSGWLKEGKSGQYISVTLGDQKNGVKVFLRNSNGEEVELTSCMVAFQEKKSEKSPDVRLTSKIEE